MAATREGAGRLKDALHRAMAGKGITSWERLGLASGVSSTTIENWVYGRTEPRARQLKQVGETLAPYTSALDLSAAYYGVAPSGSSTVQEALERHTAAVERQNELLSRLVTALGSGALLLGQALIPPEDVAAIEELRAESSTSPRHRAPAGPAPAGP